MTKKITHLLFDATPLVANKTGVGHFTERLLEALSKQPGVFITAYYFNFLGHKKSLDLPINSNIRYKEVRFFPQKILSLLRRIGLQLPVEFFVGLAHYDFAIFPNFVALPSIKGLPFAVAIHDMCFLDHPEYVQPANKKFLQRFTKIYAQRSNVIITISQFTKSRIVKHFGKTVSEKILILPIPYEQASITGRIRKPVKVASRKPYALFVGTIEPRKNILGLVRAYGLTHAGVQKTSNLVLAGGVGWLNEETMGLIENSQKTLNVLQLGYVNDAERDYLYQDAAVVCLLSQYEGFGMPILEALYYNRPLLLSSIPVFREVAGPNAVYCDQNNPKDIAEKLEQIMSKKSPESTYSFSKNYNWQHNATNLINQIDKILQGNL